MVRYEWSWEIYYGDGAGTRFPFYFERAPDSEIKVRIEDAEGLTYEVSNFRIVPAGPGDPYDAAGVIEYPYPATAPLGEDEVIYIYRVTPMIQPLAIADQSNFLLENIETALDRIVMLVQEVAFRHWHELDGFLTQPLDITNQGEIPSTIWDVMNECLFILAAILNRSVESDASGLGVYIIDADGAVVSKVPADSYRVRPGNPGPGGYVDYPWPPDAGPPLPDGAEIEIARETSTNTLPFPGPDFNPRQLEQAMDRLVMICQEVMGS